MDICYKYTKLTSFNTKIYVFREITRFRIILMIFII